MNRKELKEDAKKLLKSHLGFIVLTNIVVLGLIALSNVFSIIVAGPLLVGFNVILFKIIKDNKQDFKSILFGFEHVFVESFMGYLLQVVFTFLWSLLFIIPGIIKSYSYSMTTYILADEPNITGSEALKKSMAMTHGHKMELFILDLSFLGWTILSILTFGIGFIFLNPYKNLTYAQIYLKLKNDNIKDDSNGEINFAEATII